MAGKAGGGDHPWKWKWKAQRACRPRSRYYSTCTIDRQDSHQTNHPTLHTLTALMTLHRIWASSDSTPSLLSHRSRARVLQQAHDDQVTTLLLHTPTKKTSKPLHGIRPPGTTISRRKKTQRGSSALLDKMTTTVESQARPKDFYNAAGV